MKRLGWSCLVWLMVLLTVDAFGYVDDLPTWNWYRCLIELCGLIVLSLAMQIYATKVHK